MKNQIKAFFNRNPNLSIKPKELSKKLSFNEPHEYSKLKSVLHSLIEEGVLDKTGKRYHLTPIAGNALKGKIEILKDGSFGFVTLDDKQPGMADVFVPERFLSTALDGDTVEISLLAKKKGKNIEGEVIEVIERYRKEIPGTLHYDGSFYFVVPDDIKIHRDIYVAEKYLNNAKPNDKVIVSSIKWNNSALNPEGKIMEVLGKVGSYDAEIASLAKEFDLRRNFGKKVEKEVSEIPLTVTDDDLKNRLDLRDKDIFTIDPDTAKDFDDAVSVEYLSNGNRQIGIHIADVSHYVSRNTEVFKEAQLRGTSVYFVGKVIPMLPEKLSNKVCSLVPNEDRLTYSVIAEIDKNCVVLNYKIQKTVINSKRRFTYDEVQEILTSGKGDYLNELKELNTISQTLRKKRTIDGSINFYTPEVEFELDDSGTPIGVKIKKTNESHQLIEELMLLANRVVAGHIHLDKNKKAIPFVYRIHDTPSEEKLFEFSNFVKSLGYNYSKNDLADSKKLQRLLENIVDTDEEALINEVAIRSMAKAIYSTKNIGHFGLGFEFYTHFTSPIRRFPDLLVHILIFEYITKGKAAFDFDLLNEYCENSSLKERNAINAERLSIKLKQIQYLKNKVGEEFEAVISGITHFGIFVELKDSLAEGLIKVKDMADDFYIYDEKKYMLIGKHSKRKFRLGDRLNVKLIAVKEEQREIDFALLD